MTAPNDRAARALLLDIATALALVSALVYAAGWTYAYHYFGHFKLGLLMLGIPTRYYFGYGFLGVQRMVAGVGVALWVRGVALSVL